MELGDRPLSVPTDPVKELFNPFEQGDSMNLKMVFHPLISIRHND